jgi:hypothetical protein
MRIEDEENPAYLLGYAYGCLVAIQRTSFGHPYKVESWLNMSCIVVGVCKEAQKMALT